MNWGGPEFILWIVGISTAGWVATTWIRARHGYSLEDEWGGKTKPVATQETEALRLENSQLRDQLGQVESRVKVLERIATDPTSRLSHQINALRDERENVT